MEEFEFFMTNFAKEYNSMADGKIVKSGGPELALELEEQGYEFLKDLAPA